MEVVKMSTTFWIQFLGVIFGLGMLYFSFVKFKRREINTFEFWGWMTVWVVLILVAIFPGILDSIIAPLNFYRRLDFFVVIGFFALLALSFYNYAIVKKVERKMEVFLRNMAIKEHKNKKSVKVQVKKNKK
jgi:hypothetical protein